MQRHQLEDAARDAMRDAGLDPGPINADGEYHRFATSAKRGDDAGWYRFTVDRDGIVGAFGDWRGGMSERFYKLDDGAKPDAARRMHSRAHAMQREAAKERQDSATRKASALLNAGVPADESHPYLRRKDVSPTGLRMLDVEQASRIIGYPPKTKSDLLQGTLLLAPYYADDGTLRTVEMIDVEGRKAALFGGSKKGAFWSSDTLVGATSIGFAEGIATAKTIAECIPEPCLSVGSCGNFAAVMERLRITMPYARFVVYGDLGNGNAAAAEAAERFGAVFVSPPEDLADGDEGGTDFNDMRTERGADAVRDWINAAIAPKGIVRFAESRKQPDLDFVFPGLLVGSVGLMVGQGSIGKSYFSLEMLIGLANGQPPAGADALRPPKAGACGALFGEDNQDILRSRLCALREKHQITDDDDARLDKLIEIRSTLGQDMRIQRFDFNTPMNGAFLSELTRFCNGKRLALIDPLAFIHDADERDNGQMAHVMRTLTAVASATECAIVILHHMGKGNGDRETWASARGASAVTTGARWQLNMSPPTKDEMQTQGIDAKDRDKFVHCEVAKVNYGAKPPDFWLHRGPQGVLEWCEPREGTVAKPSFDSSRSAGPTSGSHKKDRGWHGHGGNGDYGSDPPDSHYY